MSSTANDAESKHLFLHLSDIHFSRQDYDPYDLDKDLRNQLALDAQTVVKELGNVTAILVTGDIAFSGIEPQYKVASQWLNSLADLLGCHPKVILVTPGNHDINRGCYDADEDLRRYQERLRTSQPDEVVDVLQSAGTKLYEPLKSYNQFAGEFGCEINYDRPCWDRTLELGHDITLRFRGLNSVLACNANDDANPKRLSLGEHQVQVDDADQ